MNKKNKIKAHHILSDENFSNQSLRGETSNIDEKEIQIASIIYTYLSSKKVASQEEEKEQIRKRIKLSVQKIQHKNRAIITRWAVAASILFVAFSVWLFQNNLSKTVEITEFAQTLNNVKPDSVTNLLFQDGRKVLISEKESQIAYDKEGENIHIDSARTVSQQIVAEEQVFNTLVVPYGKRSQITLSDGSKVWLNSGSKLVYPANIKEKRTVYIEGEAIFEVTHSEQHPFFVVTKGFEIKVLGTVFNVTSYPDDNVSSTVLERGKIELASTEKNFLSKEKLTILPGTMAVYNPDEKTFNQQKVDTRDYMSWRDGYFIFKDESLENITKKLERYYNVKIDLQNEIIGKEKFSGNLNLRTTPEEVLNVIAETTPFFVTHENQKLIINLN